MIEVPVERLSTAAGREAPFGSRRKGAFDLGLFVEAGARTDIHVPWMHDVAPVLLPRGWESNGEGRKERRESLRRPGIVYADCSDIISTGQVLGYLWDYDMRGFLADLLLLNWTNPIGAHEDIEQPGVFEIIRTVIEDGKVKAPPAVKPGSPPGGKR
jgi:hypothetical protein